MIFDSVEFVVADPWDNLRDVYCALSSPEKNSFFKVLCTISLTFLML